MKYLLTLLCFFPLFLTSCKKDKEKCVTCTAQYNYDNQQNTSEEIGPFCRITSDVLMHQSYYDKMRKQRLYFEEKNYSFRGYDEDKNDSVSYTFTCVESK